MNTNTNTTPVAPKTTRKGSGRTKGSFSFVKIPLASLVSKFADASTECMVSRKWAEAVGFNGLTATDAAHSYETIQGKASVVPSVVAKVTDLDSAV